ncbi:MAG: sigma 54-interacting transcriptional regulator [Bacillota bacterium]|nr:sigma 54-interacting transcriptional regulator [Bacillota bacterium]
MQAMRAERLESGMAFENRKRNDSQNAVIDQIIQQSLQSSKELDLDPDMNVNTSRVEQNILEQRKMERFELMYIIEGLNDLLKNNIGKMEEFIVTDEDGIVVYIKENPRNPNYLIETGICMAYQSVGTNGIGLALQHAFPIKVQGKQHFLESLHTYTSVGIPIISNRILLGCVGILTENGNVKSLRPGILAYMVETAVSSSSKMLETRKHMDELYLLKEFFNHLDNKKGLMVIDLQYKILQMSQEAEAVLGIEKNEVIGKNMCEFVSEEWLKKSLTKTEIRAETVFFNTSHGKVELMTHITPAIGSKLRLLGWNFQFTLPANRESISSRKTKFEFKDIVGQNKDFIRMLKLARAIAPNPSNVLITGESGTGKELVAQAIHYGSYCKNGPFVAINCAAIPRELMETELFGYLDGAFTGARRGGMQGKFGQANGGTLFLDEIGDMPIELQSKLLRVIQDRLVVPVGGNKEIPINIRLLSATNQNLEDLISQGSFRADLFYRLNVINLRLPPLRERKDDIEILAIYFANLCANKLNKNIYEITPEALEQLRTYNWPGNIRELENVIEMAVNLCGEVIDVQHLRANIVRSSKTQTAFVQSVCMDGEIVSLEEVEKQQIIKALTRYGGNISHTANILEIGRTTLYRKIKKYDLFQYVK